jgi:hypothetical protein
MGELTDNAGVEPVARAGLTLVTPSPLSPSVSLFHMEKQRLTKFSDTSLRPPQGRLAANDAASCLGLIKHFDEPNPRISGWSRQGNDVAARRALKRPRCSL